MNEFIATLAPYAQRHGMVANVLPSLIVAQGILETGGGTSELARLANNLFGIKRGMGWDGEVHEVKTSEYRKNDAGDNEIYYIVAEFRKYDSYEGAVINLCEKYNTMPRYAAVLNNYDFHNVSQAVKDAGYATDPKYPTKLRNIYEMYNLAQYDEGFIKEETPMAVFKVGVGAGHGKNTAGKRTPDGIREWTFNDTVVRAIIAELNTYENVEVLRVDDPSGRTDVPLQTRTNKVNAFGADAYVSVHHNANTGRWGTWTGAETYVYTPASANPSSVRLAKAVHPRLVKAMGLRDRGIKAANFHVLRESKMAAILTEGGYMDSTIDIKKMKNSAVLKEAGKGIARGIAVYGNLKKKPVATKPVSNPRLYRVRKTWTDASSQLGAYAELDGAIDKAKANAGYEVYDYSGKKVYPAPAPEKPTTDNLYRVRELWSDVDSQIGAYASLDTAKALADANIKTNVYDSSGGVVYNPRKARDEEIAKTQAAEAEAKAMAAAIAKAKAEAEAKAKAEADAKAKAEAAAIAKASSLAVIEEAIVMNTDRDYEAARLIHLATGLPMFERAGLFNRKVARHVIGVGGTIEELIDNNADKVTMVAGKTQSQTIEVAKAYVASL